MNVRALSDGTFLCQCPRCGAQGRVRSPVDFARGHRCQYYGAGDLVAKATGALGIKPCKPCEKRKQQLNGLVPRFWRK
jgi:hypothetical protein